MALLPYIGSLSLLFVALICFTVGERSTHGETRCRKPTSNQVHSLNHCRNSSTQRESYKRIMCSNYTPGMSFRDALSSTHRHLCKHMCIGLQRQTDGSWRPEAHGTTKGPVAKPTIRGAESTGNQTNGELPRFQAPCETTEARKTELKQIQPVFDW